MFIHYIQMYYYLLVTTDVHADVAGLVSASLLSFLSFQVQPTSLYQVKKLRLLLRLFFKNETINQLPKER